MVNIITRTFKSKRKQGTSNMARRKSTKSRAPVKRNSSNDIGILGKIPVAGKLLKNKKVQKALLASSVAGTALTLAKLIPFEPVQQVARQPLAKPILAATVDPLGGAVAFVEQNPNIIGIGGQSNSGMMDMGGMA